MMQIPKQHSPGRAPVKGKQKAMTNKTGVGEIDTPEQGEEDEDAKTRGSIMVSMPIEMKLAVQEYAKNQEVPTVAFVRQLIADKVGYTGPLTKGRTVTRFEGTPEERKEARKAVAKERRQIFSKLLEKYNGNLDKLAEDLIGDEDEEEDE